MVRRPRVAGTAPLRKPHIYALLAPIALAVLLVMVVGGDRPPVAERVPSIPAAEVAETTSTTSDLDLEIPETETAAIVLSAVEEALTEEASEATTTTSTTSTTTTAPPTAPKSSPSTTQPPTTSPPTTSPTTTAPSTGFEPGFRSNYESDFQGRINSLRSSKGLGKLTSNGSLTTRARHWAKKVAEADKLMHSNLGSLVPPWMAAGENLGVGGSVSSVFSGLKASSSHLSNMLGDFTHFGVGVYQDSSGRIWTVHVFAR